MAKIPDEDIERVKREADLIALARARGIELKKHGSKDYVGRCPFHEDNESPNLVISPAKGLYHCMACGAAGNAVQFVQRFDGVSFRHAFELLDSGGKAAFENVKTAPTTRKRPSTPILPSPVEPDAADGELLDQVRDYYHERLAHSKAALEYLTKRGLGDEELMKRFKVGFADRTLGLRLPSKQTAKGKEMRGRLQKLGVIRPTGHEHLNGSVVFPVANGDGHVSEMYGRKITADLRKGTPDHLYLPGPHRGIFNPDALTHPEIILCESIIDALTFVRHGMGNATCIYGTQGFTDELFRAIEKANPDSVRIAYDPDESGEKAAARDAKRLQKIGVECFRIRLPIGEDANSYALAAGPEALKKAVRSAAWIGAGAPVPSSLAAKSLAAETPVDAGKAAKKKKPNTPTKAPDLPELVASGEFHTFTLAEREYRVGGLFKNPGLDAIKITLRLWSGDRFYLDQVDLCRDPDRRRFCERAGHECRAEPEIIKRDLGKLLLACERAQEERLHAGDDDGPEAVAIAPEEKAEAEALLKSPDLVEKLGGYFDAAGIVGEQTNRLACYLAATSRLQSRPLAVIIQSTSAAGKTTLMEAVLAFFPPEEQVKYSAMTGQSLYYLGEKNLKHKVLAIVEEEGAEKASYALKLLQSEGELTIASTGKDAHTGRMKTEEYRVEGPVAIVLTTTSIDIDEELMNRCLVLTVDESKAQTERIHALQRTARTLEGLRLRRRREKILTLLQNAQRLLKPVAVVNPYADLLTFTADRTRTRRDHEKYLTLIESVTLLHQKQRPLEDDPEAGPHIRTTPEDVATANRLAPEVLGRSLDELPPQTRRMLEDLKKMVAETCEARKIDPDKCRFTRRQVRERTGASETQCRLHLARLEEFEYIAKRQGRNGVSCTYELLVACNEPEDTYHVGLIDASKLRPEGGGK